VCCISYDRFRLSTETAATKVFNDLLLAADDGEVSVATIIHLLDLTAAFGIMDHDLMLLKLEHQFGLSGIVLKCFQSYVWNRTFRVIYNGSMSCIVQNNTWHTAIATMPIFCSRSVLRTHGRSLCSLHGWSQREGWRVWRELSRLRWRHAAVSALWLWWHSTLFRNSNIASQILINECGWPS